MSDYCILVGDCREMLRTLPDESVHCVVTSPPYWGLRDYGLPPTVWGGDPDCDHEWGPQEKGKRKDILPAEASTAGRLGTHERATGLNDGGRFCVRCGAWRGQLGLEPTPELYVEHMVEVFREVRRVLRRDGTLWLNLGDSYAVGGMSNPSGKSTLRGPKDRGASNYQISRRTEGLKPKDLVGIPWLVAFALRDDGWVLRSDIVWAKVDPMPESVTDRPTKSHEFVFLFSKARWTGDYPPRTMSASDARWLALLIETEGNIVIRRYTHGRKQPQHAVQVAVANSDRAILEEARRIAGGGTILVRGGKNRNVYYLQWTTKAASRILWECLPYLFGKRQQALCALFLESRRNNSNKGVRCDIYEKDGRHYRLTQDELALRDRLWRTVKALNQHQPIDTSWIPEPREGRWVPNRYYYDADAIREELATPPHAPGNRNLDASRNDQGRMDRVWGSPAGRNKRSVWTIATGHYTGAHFAVFPPQLAEPCILAGTSERGCCPECGAPWERVVERIDDGQPTRMSDPGYSKFEGQRRDNHRRGPGTTFSNNPRERTGGSETTGWRPGCDCNAGDPVPCMVLDPFAGSGTVGMVATGRGRRAILIDLNPQYADMMRDRCGPLLEAPTPEVA